MLIAQVVRVPSEGIGDFRRFEAGVLPLLPEHGGVLERRLRSLDGSAEIHIVRFPSSEALESYMADPRRQEQLHLPEESQAVAERMEVADVTEAAD